MIHGGDERGFQQSGLARLRLRAADHQPDHLSKGEVADEVLDLLTPDGNVAWLHVNDGGLPPVCHVAHITPFVRNMLIASSS